MKRLARLIESEECDIETDIIPENKTITLIKKIKIVNHLLV